MKENSIPENFIPLVTIGEIEGYLVIYTAASHEDVLDILEQAAEVLQEGDKDQELTLQ
jgi:hypothetical protein